MEKPKILGSVLARAHFSLLLARVRIGSWQNLGSGSVRFFLGSGSFPSLLSSRRASPPFGLYQITLLGDRGTWHVCVWTSCPGSLPGRAAAGNRTYDPLIGIPPPYSPPAFGTGKTDRILSSRVHRKTRATCFCLTDSACVNDAVCVQTAILMKSLSRGRTGWRRVGWRAPRICSISAADCADNRHLRLAAAATLSTCRACRSTA